MSDQRKDALLPAGVCGTPHVSSSSLEHLESKSDAPNPSYIRHTKYGSPEFDVQPITPDESSFRHNGWAVRRQQIWKCLVSINARDARLSRFANCGSGLWLEKSEAGDDMRLRCNRCHDRWCVPCMNERCLKMRETLCRIMAGEYARFMTFTLRHSQTPLKDQVDRLYRSFNKLRERESWRKHVLGGASFIEIKLASTDGCWHVHLHCLVVGSFWDQKEISREWHAVTGDSSIIDVRAVGDSQHAINYVTKYVTKPADSTVYASPTHLQELVITLAGRRLCATFGTWRGHKLEQDPPDDVKWISVGSIDNLRSKANQGDGDALRWLEAAARKWPLMSTYFCTPPPTSTAVAE